MYRVLQKMVPTGLTGSGTEIRASVLASAENHVRKLNFGFKLVRKIELHVRSNIKKQRHRMFKAQVLIHAQRCEHVRCAHYTSFAKLHNDGTHITQSDTMVIKGPAQT